MAWKLELTLQRCWCESERKLVLEGCILRKMPLFKGFPLYFNTFHSLLEITTFLITSSVWRNMLKPNRIFKKTFFIQVIDCENDELQLPPFISQINSMSRGQNHFSLNFLKNDKWSLPLTNDISMKRMLFRSCA